jgi:hypothetical protein
VTAAGEEEKTHIWMLLTDGHERSFQRGVVRRLVLLCI